MKFDTGVMNHSITATAVSTAALMIAIAGQGTVVKGIGGDVNFCSRLDHRHGRQHRVDREHEVQQQDLPDHVADADLLGLPSRLA